MELSNLLIMPAFLRLISRVPTPTSTVENPAVGLQQLHRPVIDLDQMHAVFGSQFVECLLTFYRLLRNFRPVFFRVPISLHSFPLFVIGSIDNRCFIFGDHYSILQIGRMDDHLNELTKRIQQDSPLAPFSFLASAEAAFIDRTVSFQTLRIEQGKAWDWISGAFFGAVNSADPASVPMLPGESIGDHDHKPIAITETPSVVCALAPEFYSGRGWRSQCLVPRASTLFTPTIHRKTALDQVSLIVGNIAGVHNLDKPLSNITVLFLL